jgi:hypothetical protein
MYLSTLPMALGLPLETFNLCQMVTTYRCMHSPGSSIIGIDLALLGPDCEMDPDTYAIANFLGFKMLKFFSL